MIYEWFTKKTERVVLDYIDDLYHTKSYTGMANDMKLISFNINDAHYTIIISPDNTIKHSGDLPELVNLKPFILQHIRDNKINNILNI